MIVEPIHLRRLTIFDFCIAHTCSLHLKCCESNDVMYLFEFADGYQYRYRIAHIDLIEVDHRVLESEMLDLVEYAYIRKATKNNNDTINK